MKISGSHQPGLAKVGLQLPPVVIKPSATGLFELYVEYHKPGLSVIGCFQFGSRCCINAHLGTLLVLNNVLGFFLEHTFQ